MKQAIKEFERIIRKYDLDYDQVQYSIKKARKNMHLQAPERKKELPVLLSDDEMMRFRMAVLQHGDLRKIVMIDLMYLSGLRVSEALNLRVSDIYPGSCKIYIHHGKGKKDRYVLYPASIQYKIRDLLRIAGDGYLFRNPTTNKPYSARSIQLYCKRIAAECGIKKDVHPHLFRHHFATALSADGMTADKLGVLMGHASPESTKVYQHVTPEAMRGQYDHVFNR